MTDQNESPIGHAPHGRWLDALALAGLGVFVLALFARLAFTNRVLATGDVYTYFTPYRDFAAAALRAGKLPLWNPYLFLGVPFLANSQAAVFYPLHWPLAWLSTPRAIVWTIVLHAWLGGAFTYGWLRHGLRLRPLAAWLGGIAFAGSGFIGGHVGQINQLNAYAWFPALLWVLAGLQAQKPGFSAGKVQRPGFLAGIIIGGIFAVQLLAGHTQAWYISAIGAGLYALAGSLGAAHPPHAASSERVAAWRRAQGWLRPLFSRAGAWPLLILALGLVIGLGLAAIQLVPTLEL
ncbi:MAG: hypothetical protein WA029_18650, partial [Anaerolineae bacterium]